MHTAQLVHPSPETWCHLSILCRCPGSSLQRRTPSRTTFVFDRARRGCDKQQQRRARLFAPHAKRGQLSHTSSEDGRREEVPHGHANIEPGSSNNAGLSKVDVSLMVYGCSALYLPAALYASASAALTIAAFPATPPSMAATVAPLLQAVLGWFSQLAAAHHALLNFCIACAFLPFLRSRVPRYARDHLLESNFMATLSLDLFPIFLHYAVVGRLLHYATLALSLAMAALALFSAINVLRINMQDPRDSMEARATTAIWALILMILGVCAKKVQYFIFILPLLWLRWQRYKFTQSRSK